MEKDVGRRNGKKEEETDRERETGGKTVAFSLDCCLRKVQVIFLQNVLEYLEDRGVILRAT